MKQHWTHWNKLVIKNSVGSFQTLWIYLFFLSFDTLPLVALKAEPSNKFFIFKNAVEPPMNTILLVRDESSYSALKFTNISSQTIDCEVIDFKLDSIFSKKFSPHLIKLDSRFEAVGFHNFHLIFYSGNNKIKIKDKSLHWAYPRMVHIPEPKKGQKSLSFAPTPWKNFEEIDPRIDLKTSLNWYSYDDARNEIIVDPESSYTKQFYQNLERVIPPSPASFPLQDLKLDPNAFTPAKNVNEHPDLELLK